VSARAPAASRPLPDESPTPAVNAWDRAFLSSIAHELRTPLTVVRGALSLLGQRADELPDESAMLFVLALRNSERLSRAIEAILDHAAIVAGSLDLVLEPVGATELAEAARAHAQPVADRRGITVRTDVRTRRELCGDRVRLARVLASLALTAVEAAPLGSTVTMLAVDGPDGSVCFAALIGAPDCSTAPDPAAGCPPDSFVAQGWPPASGEEVECSSNQLVVLRHGGRLWTTDTAEYGAVRWILIPSEGKEKG
jgi:hypothetical protein